jgi:hypothetical protein
VAHDTVILPFGDKNIYDSFMASYPIGFKDGMMSALEKFYAEAQQKHGIATKLE